MKTRKLLPLIILAVVAVLTLSSCDALLDAIFASNQISVDVAVLGSSHPDFAVSGRYVTVLLTGPGVSSSADTTYGSWDGTRAHFYFTFADLPDGGYNLSATFYGSSISGTSDFVTMPFIDSSNPDSTGKSVSLLLYIN